MPKDAIVAGADRTVTVIAVMLWAIAKHMAKVRTAAKACGSAIGRAARQALPGVLRLLGLLLCQLRSAPASRAARHIRFDILASGSQSGAWETPRGPIGASPEEKENP